MNSAEETNRSADDPGSRDFAVGTAGILLAAATAIALAIIF